MARGRAAEARGARMTRADDLLDTMIKAAALRPTATGRATHRKGGEIDHILVHQALAGAVGDGLDEHPVVVALLPVQDVAHGLGHAALAVDVELCEGVVHGVGQAHDARDPVVIAPAPVEGGEVNAGDPVNGLGQHEDGGNTDHGDSGQAPDIWGEKG